MEICNCIEAEELVLLLREKKVHVATAESCTGGKVASGIVDVSGASEVFEEGYVTYSDRVKEKLLGVSHETLEEYTAVSAQVAEEMARGVCKVADVELGISVTGYAGPKDAPDGTKAGTVFIGVCYNGKTSVLECHFLGDRNVIREQAATEAIHFALHNMTQ